MNKLVKFKFREVPKFFLYLIAPATVFIICLIWLSFFIMFSWIGKTILILLIILITLLFLKNAIREIAFYDDKIVVNFYIKKEFLINYSDIKKMEEIQQGFFLFSLIQILTLNKIKGKRKFPFYCPKQQRSQLDNFLSIKNIIIKK